MRNIAERSKPFKSKETESKSVFVGYLRRERPLRDKADYMKEIPHVQDNECEIMYFGPLPVRSGGRLLAPRKGPIKWLICLANVGRVVLY
jgi:hypothetical protein